jgi:hypothetical protein
MMQWGLLVVVGIGVYNCQNPNFTVSQMTTTVKLISTSEFMQELRALHALGRKAAPSKIPVSVVNYVYLCPDAYELIKTAYYEHTCPSVLKSSALIQVFYLLDLICTNEDFDVGNEQDSKACAAFAGCDNVPVLEFLWKRGFYWDEKTLFAAVRSQSLNCFKFVIGKQCPLTSLTFSQLLQFVHVYGTHDMICCLLEKK